MAGGFLGRVAADTLGISDIGKIIDVKDFDKVDGDDFILHEDGEKIYYVIKSKTDEYVFTNYGLIHVDGKSAVDKKRLVKRYEFKSTILSQVYIETAGMIDLDIEIKFNLGEETFSIDVDRNQMTKLKQIYKTLVEISRMQQHHKMLFQDGVTGLERANAGISRNLIQGDIVEAVEKLTNFNLDWMEALRKEYQVRDYSNVYEKYRLV
ncbi:MAG: PH domain-containing protein [Cellulosilyticum sp.]|nr:PH domain-containing protein [Cellulosilyticum sp.]MEE1072201.1 PH domain-containing protein [Cellulosilyticum sp.]